MEEIQENQPLAKWYVVHTYSGYENKVKTDIEKTVVNRDLGNEILEVIIPVEEVVEVKDGVKKVTQRKLFPGNILVHMVMNEKNWYTVRNIRGVTGFVGANSAKPTPLTDEELARIGIGEITKQNKIEVDFEVGDEVKAISGAWRDTVGKVSSINDSKQTVTIMVSMFGRETPVELGFTEVKKKA